MKLALSIIIWFLFMGVIIESMGIDLAQGLCLCFCAVGLALLIYIATQKQEPNDTLPSYNKQDEDADSPGSRSL